MPKKHRRFNSFKPEAPVHHSLTTSRSQNDASRSDERSVNGLIQRLRRTQLTKGQTQNAADAAHVMAKSVHPSIRSILDLPETPAPRPRPGLRPQVGTRRLRRTPGPAAPMSWLSSVTDSDQQANIEGGVEVYRGEYRRRLDHLPGANFPLEQSFQHMILKAMASNWDWHLIYDGAFLSELPTHVKQLLLSYIAMYTDHASMEVGMQGLKPLFMDKTADGELETHSDVIRLDLCGALGRWTSLKVLRRELRIELPSSMKQTMHVPTSWEEEMKDESSILGPSGFVPNQPFIRRFKNLRYLSLAQPAPGAANWSSLLNLLSSLATLTHLSLAHWPIPTLSVSAAVNSGSSTSSSQHSLLAEANIPEAAMVLGKLSRTTYCLEWLDLEGCTEWHSALCWVEDGQKTLGAEWNGSWRGLSWLGLGPGWTPEPIEGNVEPGGRERPISVQSQAEPLHDPGNFGSRWSALRPPSTSESSIQPSVRDEQAARDQALQKAARLRSQEKLWRHHIGKAKIVRKRIQNLRYEGKGKWIDIVVGDEHDDVSVSNDNPYYEYSTI